MKKVCITLLTLSFVFCFGTITLATNNFVNEVKGTMNRTGEAIGNTVEGAASTAHDSVNKAEKNIEGTINNTKNAVTSTFDNSRNAGYTATRTATTPDTTDNTTMTMTWSWIIIGITILTIGGLVWYYTSDSNKSKIRNER